MKKTIIPKTYTESNSTVHRFVPVPTLRLPFFLLIPPVLLVAGYLRAESHILYTAAAFFLLLVLLAMIASFVLCLGVRVSFSYKYPYALKNERNSMVLTIENNTFIPILAGRAAVCAPETDDRKRVLSLEIRRLSLCFSCGAFSEQRVEEDVTFPYSGSYDAACVRISLYDPLRLFRAVCSADITASTSIIPDRISDDIVHVAISERMSEIVAMSAANNSGDEFFDIRDYIPGDSQRDIHWKLSAKNDALTVIRRSSQVKNRFVAVCDTGFFYGCDEKELVLRDAVLGTMLAVLYGAPDEGVSLVFNGGAVDVGRETDAESAICAAIAANAHPVGVFSPNSEYFADCACLLIITARVTDAMLDFIAAFRMGEGVGIPVDIVYMGSEELPLMRLDALHVNILKGGAGQNEKEKCG